MAKHSGVKKQESEGQVKKAKMSFTGAVSSKKKSKGNGSIEKTPARLLGSGKKSKGSKKNKANGNTHAKGSSSEEGSDSEEDEDEESEEEAPAAKPVAAATKQDSSGEEEEGSDEEDSDDEEDEAPAKKPVAVQKNANAGKKEESDEDEESEEESSDGDAEAPTNSKPAVKRPAEDMEDQGDKFQVSNAASFRLFIGVQQTIPEQEELLSHLGLDQDKITDQHVLYQPDRGNNPRGLTILEVADKETYESVLAMNGGDLKGNTLVIQPARQRDGGGRGGGGGFGRGGRGGGGRGRGDFGSRGGFGGRGGNRGGGRDFRGGNRGGGRDFRGGNRGGDRGRGGRGFGRGGDRGGFRGGNSSFDGPSNKKTRFDE